MKSYLELLKKIKAKGRPRGDRTGTGTLSIFTHTFEHDMRDGFPLPTTKKMHLRGIFQELMAIIRGELHMETLVAEGVTIWDPWRQQEDVKTKRQLANYERIDWMRQNAPEVLDKWEKLNVQVKPEVQGHDWLDKHGVPRSVDVVAARAGDLNAPYGPGWRAFQTAHGPVDQFAYAMELLRNNPESRRILVSAWNPGWMPEETRQIPLDYNERDELFKKMYPDEYREAQEVLSYPEIAGDIDFAYTQMDEAGVPTHKTVKVTPQENIVNGKPCLTPCHWAFEFYTEEMTVEERWLAAQKVYTEDNIEDMYAAIGRYLAPTEQEQHEQLDKLDIPRRYLSLKWHQRSCDVFLGIPYNIPSYALLLQMVAHQLNMAPYMLVGDLTNVHIYNDHMEMVDLQLTREPLPLPLLRLGRHRDRIEDYEWADVVLENYHYHPAIKAKPSI